MSTGAYQPLPNETSIRALRFEILDIGNGIAKQIHGSFVFIDLNDPNHPAYEALSYAWGDPEPVTQVTFEGSFKIGVAQNLSDGLTRLNRDGQTELIWIDALCIDQKNVHERNQQVQMMGRIFAEAVRVRVWLGFGDDEKIEAAFEVLERCANPLRDDSDGRETLKKLENANHKTNAKLSAAIRKIVPDPAILDTNLSGLFNQSWFERLWAVQEVWLGHDVEIMACADLVIRYDTLGRGLWLLARSTPDASELLKLHSFPFLHIFIAQYKKQKLTLTTLSYIQNFKASDPKDYIYALLAITEIDSAERSWFVVDYNKSINEVFCDSARGIIHSTSNLHHLSIGDSYRKDRSSWSTPGFSYLTVKTKTFARTTQIYNQLHGRKARVGQHERLDELLLGGRLFFEIDHIHKDADRENVLQKLLDWYETWHEKQRQLHPESFCRFCKDITCKICANFDKSFAYTLTGGLMHLLGPGDARIEELVMSSLYILLNEAAKTIINSNDYSKIDENICYLALSLLEGDKSIPNRVEKMGLPIEIDKFGVDFCSACLRCSLENARFFFTQDGLFGIGAGEFEVGDRLCALYGSNVLWILRQDESGNHWRLVGEAFVDPFRFNDEAYWEAGVEEWISLI